MDEIFNTNDIHKTLIVCDTEDTCLQRLQELIQDDHSVSFISEDLLNDDRPLFAARIRSFAQGFSRVLLMSFNTWYDLVDVIEENAMDHNLLVISDLDAQERYIVVGWIVDAQSRGFVRYRDNYHVVLQGQDQSFSIPQE